MRITSKVYNTLPSKDSHWWQVVLIPTVAIMNNIQEFDPYVAINIEVFLIYVLDLVRYIQLSISWKN